MPNSIDCFTCSFAERDKHNRFIDRCSGYGNCSYERFDGEIKDTLNEYIEKLFNKYTHEHNNYSEDYINGVKDALLFIKNWNDTE